MNDKKTEHSFDVAKQGYVNVLPVQHKKSKAPGDSSDSIEARHRFLTAGNYEPLLDTLKNLMVNSIGHLIDETPDELLSELPNDEQSVWLDIGCGEGYYTLGMAEVLERLSIVGVDISKIAVMQLAKSAKQKNKLWSQKRQANEGSIYPLVASASSLPLAADAVMGISSVFSPILPAEFARVLAPGGRLIIAKPNKEHLTTVREALFDKVQEHDSDKFLSELEPYFSLNQRIEVENELRLNSQAMVDLLTMTPYAYRAKRKNREALLQQIEKEGTMMTQAKFVVYELTKVH